MVEEDYRERCEREHLVCGWCGVCACDRGNGGDFEPVVKRDKRGRTLCQECRYEEREYDLVITL